MYGLLTRALSKPSHCDSYTHTHTHTNTQVKSKGRERRKRVGGREGKREKVGREKRIREEEKKESAFSSWWGSNSSVHSNRHYFPRPSVFPLEKWEIWT